MSGRRVDIPYPSNDREMKEALQDWLSDLNEVMDSLIIVEGKKDTNALRELGIEKEIIEVNQGKNMFDLIHDIAGDPTDRPPRIIILTDWDRKGGILARKLEKACLRHAMDPDLEFRRTISILTSKWIKTVESIPSFLNHLDA